MSKRKVHWQPTGAAHPRARCGVWIASAIVTRKKDEVSCRKCRKYLVQAELALEPMRGRPMEVTYRDGSTERGQLMDAVRAGLELCGMRDGKRFLARWSRVKGAEFLDKDTADETRGDA